MKRNLIIGVIILAIMVASGGVVYAATHKIDKVYSVSVNVTEELPIMEDIYLDANLTQPAPAAFTLTYPQGGSADKILYVSGNISKNSLEFLSDNLPGDIMVSGIPLDTLPSGVTPIRITAYGGAKGFYSGANQANPNGIKLAIKGSSN